MTQEHHGNQIEAAIIKALQENPGGMTTAELVHYTGYESPDIAPLLRPLVRAERIVELGRQIKSGETEPLTVWGPKL
jgi:hypothetical protein